MPHEVQGDSTIDKSAVQEEAGGAEAKKAAQSFIRLRSGRKVHQENRNG